MKTIIKNETHKSHRSFSRTRWTLKEKMFLVDKYRSVPLSILCDMLGKTPKAIQMKAARMGLNTNVISNQLNLSLSTKPINWTDKQILFLKNFYNKLSNSTIINCDPFMGSGITVQQLADKAYELGITKVKRYEPAVELYTANIDIQLKDNKFALKTSITKKRFFNETEIKVLKNLINKDGSLKMRIVDIAKMMERNESSISKKLKELKG